METVYETERLLLKVLEEEDADKVLAFYEGNREIFEEYEIDRVENFYTREHQAALLRCEYGMMQRQQSIRFWVFTKENPEEIIGTYSFHNIRYSAYRDCQLGYKFRKEVWGNGYARESIAPGIKVMFEKLKLHRIEAMVMPQNTRSKKLLTALGFESEGVKRQNVKLHGVWRDHEVYSLLNEG